MSGTTVETVIETVIGTGIVTGIVTVVTVSESEIEIVTGTATEIGIEIGIESVSTGTGTGTGSVSTETGSVIESVNVTVIETEIESVSTGIALVTGSETGIVNVTAIGSESTATTASTARPQRVVEPSRTAWATHFYLALVTLLVLATCLRPVCLRTTARVIATVAALVTGTSMPGTAAPHGTPSTDTSMVVATRRAPSRGAPWMRNPRATTPHTVVAGASDRITAVAGRARSVTTRTSWQGVVCVVDGIGMTLILFVRVNMCACVCFVVLQPSLHGFLDDPIPRRSPQPNLCVQLHQQRHRLGSEPPKLPQQQSWTAAQPERRRWS